MLIDATLNELNDAFALFERAANYPGSSRERMVALAEAEILFFQRYPVHYRALQLVRMVGQVQCDPSHDSNPLERCETRLLQLIRQQIRAGHAAGEVILPTPRHETDTAFALWALTFGVRALQSSTVGNHQLGAGDQRSTSRWALDLMLDALNWRPLAASRDYAPVRERVVAWLDAEENADIPVSATSPAPSARVQTEPPQSEPVQSKPLQSKPLQSKALQSKPLQNGQPTTAPTS